jgi:hydroxymethylpyrimidine/phosphomethylpyrimidine kinase
VLCIAGSDSAGCAGAAIDLRTVAALGGHGLLAVTAVTAQDARGLRSSAPVAPRMVRAQIDAALGGIGAEAVKIGMLATAPIVRAVAAALEQHRRVPVVLDPVLRATAGGELLDLPGRRALLGRLLPLADLVTPNIPEAEALLGLPVRGIDGMTAAAEALLGIGARAVLIKGGHLRGDAVDVFADGSRTLVLRARRIATRDTRGTGCVLSTAIACHLARGCTLPHAVRRGKAFVSAAIRGSYRVGAGRGPVNPDATGQASVGRARP